MPEKKHKAASTQRYLPIKEIKEGAVVVENGSLRAVVIISSVNFALKSEPEKDAMIMSFQSFLNSLDYPIQIVTRSRHLFLDDYLENLQKILEKEDNELLRVQIVQYIQFVTELLQSANVMEKRFFIVVPYYPLGIEKVNIFKKLFSTPPKPGQSNFETLKMELMGRVDQIIAGLSAVGLRCVVLNTEELLELYYAVYNPDTASSQKLTNVESLESPIISSSPNPPGEKNV
jgi:hypothetical protein